jgi:hypothetical protein
MFDVTLPGSLSIAVQQDHYRGHYEKKKKKTPNSCPCNDAIKIQTPKSR